MFMLLGPIFSALAPLFSSVMNYFTAKSNNAVLTNGQNVGADVAMGQAEITAQLEAQRIAAASRDKLSASRWTVWILPELCAIFSFHVFTVVLDSVFHLNWQISALPAPMDKLEIDVLMIGAGVAGGVSAYQRIFK